MKIQIIRILRIKFFCDKEPNKEKMLFSCTYFFFCRKKQIDQIIPAQNTGAKSIGANVDKTDANIFQISKTPAGVKGFKQKNLFLGLCIENLKKKTKRFLNNSKHAKTKTDCT